LSYIVTIDEDSGEYEVRRSGYSFPVGRGDSLYDALDDIEMKLAEGNGLQMRQPAPRSKSVVAEMVLANK
jgi:hypothetical protein